MRRPGGEEGAIAVVSAVFLAVALLVSAFAVDIGALVLEQRELRKVVDHAALDAVVAVGERRHEFGDLPAAAAVLAGQSAQRNGFDESGDGTLEAELGTWDPATRTFSAGGTANAVRVTATENVPFRFVSGSRTISASAVATIGSVAGIAIGTGLAELDSSNSALLDGVLSGLLGGELGLQAVHYEALVGADVTLGALASALGLSLGQVDALLDTELTVAELAAALLAARQDEVGAGIELVGIQRFIDVVSAEGGESFRLGEILDVALADGRSAAAARLNVFQLLSASAQAAGAGHAITLDLDAGLVDVGALGVSNDLRLRLAVIEPPQIAVGPAHQVDGEWVTVARSAQVRLAVDARVGINPAGLLPATVEVPLYVAAAEGEAALVGNRCAGDPAAARVDVDVATTGGSLRLAKPSDAQLVSGAVPTGPAHLVRLRANVLLLGTINVADVHGSANASFASASTGLEFPGPFGWENTQSTASTDPASVLLADLDVSATLLGSGLLSSIVNAILSTTTSVVEPIVEIVVDQTYDVVVRPVLDLLGADLAVADVTAWHQSCAHRVLTE